MGDRSTDGKRRRLRSIVGNMYGLVMVSMFPQLTCGKEIFIFLSRLGDRNL